MRINTHVSSNLPMSGLGTLLGMKKTAQMAGQIQSPPNNVRPVNPGSATPPGLNPGQPAPVTTPVNPAASLQAAMYGAGTDQNQADPSGVSLGAMQTEIGPGGGIVKGYIDSPTQDTPDAKLFFKDNKISENAMHGPFNINGKKLYYPVKYDRNSQQFVYVNYGRAVEAP
jgi:hypothetical protein